jgi:phosphatidate cytidylyltransferase
VNNLVLRIIVALVGIPVLLFAAWQGSWLLRVIVIALQAAILIEWRALWSVRGAHIFLPGIILAGAGMDAAVFTAGHSIALAVAIGGIATLLVGETFRRFRTPLLNIGASALFLIYIILPLSLWAMLGGDANQVRWAPAGALVALLVATWLCDSGAYFIGRGLGRHKLYPAASPHKTVEGLIGGILCSVLTLPLLKVMGWADPQFLDYIAIPVIVGILGQSGDLLESLMKREIQIKDTSSALPGHGGFLDRFDSLLIATPFLYAYLLLTSVQ